MNPRNNPKITGRVFYEPIMPHARLAGAIGPLQTAQMRFIGISLSKNYENPVVLFRHRVRHSLDAGVLV